jgi:hypothetical protein
MDTMSHDSQAAFTSPLTGILRMTRWFLAGGVFHEIAETALAEKVD